MTAGVTEIETDSKQGKLGWTSTSFPHPWLLAKTERIYHKRSDFYPCYKVKVNPNHRAETLVRKINLKGSDHEKKISEMDTRGFRDLYRLIAVLA